MFLEQGNEGKNDIGRWIAMIILAAVVSQFIGAIPLQILIFQKMAANPDLQPNPDNSLDLSAYDISPITGFALMIIPFVMGLITLLFLMKPIHERPMLSIVTSHPTFRWKRFFWSARVWFILMVIYAVFATITGFQKIELQFNPLTLMQLSLVSVALIPLQAGFEEVFFRGYLMQGFSQVLKYKWLTLLMTSIIFGGLHFFNPEVKEFGAMITLPQYFWFGLILGICTLMDQGVELALGVHAMNNIFLSVFFTQDSSAVQTPALFRITAFNPIFDLIAIILISALFLFIARKKFRWPEWSTLLSRVENPNLPEEELTGYLEDEYE
ncbi:MAG: CPBP family intramembrane glutamic endopeptidase [Mariniphaga sp.]